MKGLKVLLSNWLTDIFFTICNYIINIPALYNAKYFELLSGPYFSPPNSELRVKREKAGVMCLDLNNYLP